MSDINSIENKIRVIKLKDLSLDNYCSKRRCSDCEIYNYRLEVYNNTKNSLDCKKVWNLIKAKQSNRGKYDV